MIVKNNVAGTVHRFGVGKPVHRMSFVSSMNFADCRSYFPNPILIT